MCKYLQARGFFAYEFGVHPVTGLVDIEAGDYTVVSGVSSVAGEEICKYLAALEVRTEQYIANFLDIDINNANQPTYAELAEVIKQLANTNMRWELPTDEVTAAVYDLNSRLNSVK